MIFGLSVQMNALYRFISNVFLSDGVKTFKVHTCNFLILIKLEIRLINKK